MIQEQLHSLILPDSNGNFGQHGGRIGHPALAQALAEIEHGFRQIVNDA